MKFLTFYLIFFKLKHILIAQQQRNNVLKMAEQGSLSSCEETSCIITVWEYKEVQNELDVMYV